MCGGGYPSLSAKISCMDCPIVGRISARECWRPMSMTLMVLTVDWGRRQGGNTNPGELDLNRSGTRNASGQLTPVIPTCTSAQLYQVAPGSASGTGGSVGVYRLHGYT